MRLIILFLLLTPYLFGQVQPGELLLQFQSERALKDWQKANIDYNLRPLVEDWQLYLLKFDPLLKDASQLKAALKAAPELQNVQENHILKQRRSPNDPKYAQWHWNLEHLGLPEAWEYTTGGLAGEDTIVVAVLDGGIDFAHEDLNANLWVNHQEIPNDSLDNDLNGYVDDYRGWQFVHENDQHALDGHGTSVAGIIGASGNNGIGMTGINWNLKMMILSAGEPEFIYESNIIKAYAYVLKMRRLYDQTNGAEGAYVIATNLSAGIDFADAEDFPLWCAIYDSLGEAGILNVGAVMNRREDVDDVGDMPTSCLSEYLVTVTNSTEFDVLNQDAGYGLHHVDITAPGEVYSARVGDTYNVFAGSSGAAPHLAGAIALLASLPNERWQAFLHNYPQQAILQLKSILLATAFQRQSMQEKIASGGRVDIGAAMRLLNELYTEEEALEVRTLNSFGRIQFQFQPQTAGEYQWEIYDLSGRLRYQSSFVQEQAPFQLQTLEWNAKSKEVLILHLRSGKNRIAVKKFFSF
jgi:serine protease